jgi:hypothetical protein
MTGKKKDSDIRSDIKRLFESLDKLWQDPDNFAYHLVTVSHQFYFPGNRYGITDKKIELISKVIRKLPGTFTSFATGNLTKTPFMNVRKNSHDLQLNGINEVRSYVAKVRRYVRKHKLTPEQLREISKANGVFDPEFIDFDDVEDPEEEK